MFGDLSFRHIDEASGEAKYGSIAIESQLGVNLHGTDFAVLGQDPGFITTVIQTLRKQLQKDVAVLLAIFFMDVLQEERADGRLDFKTSHRRPGGIQKSPVAEVVHLEDNLFDV